MSAKQRAKIVLVKVLTRTGVFQPFTEEIDDLSTECEQLRDEVRTLGEQPATYADDNAKLCSELVDITDKYMAAQKRVNELLQERMTLANENTRFNSLIDLLQSQVDSLTIQLETERTLKPEPTTTRKPRAKKNSAA